MRDNRVHGIIFSNMQTNAAVGWQHNSLNGDESSRIFPKQSCPGILITVIN